MELIFIGDEEKDRQTAQNANCRFIHIDRTKENEPPKILTACGICQERLRYWGEDVKVAISNPENRVIFKQIKELNPYYWGKVFPDESREEYEAGILLERED